MEVTAARRKRINRLKKIILGTIGMAILVPIIICIFLGVKVGSQSKRIKELETFLTAQQKIETEVSTVSAVPIQESSKESETEQDLQEEVISYEKQIYLTFDDGPSSNTEKILDILKVYDVKATFFVVGKTDEKSKALYKRIVEEGHTLGMHSYSHKYDEVYASKESFVQDLTKLQEYLYEATGVWPRYYRFPGGSSNQVSKVDMQEFIAYLNESEITYFDWNISSGDAVNEQPSVEAIINNVLPKIDIQTECMILMHDATEKGTTVEALPEIISQIRLRGDAEFFAITDETVPIQHLKAESDN